MLQAPDELVDRDVPMLNPLAREADDRQWMGNRMKPLLRRLAARGRPVPTSVKLAAGVMGAALLLELLRRR